MRRRWTTRAFSAAAWILIVPAIGRADDSHYQDFIIGGRAMGLGGAYTSLANDPSGLYYNPAGIADVRETNYQVSTSLYGFERGAYGGGDLILPVAGLGHLNVQFTELVIVPASAGFVATLGDLGADGLPVQAYALSVIVPSFRSFSAHNPLGQEPSSAPTGMLSPLVPAYSRRVTDRTLWAGAGYGRRITSKLSLGLSAYYILRSTKDVEEVNSSAIIIDGDDDSSNDQDVFRLARNDIEFLNGSVLLIIGAKLELTNEINLGLTFQTPSLLLHSQSSMHFSVGESVPGCAELDLGSDQRRACAGDPVLSSPRSRFTVTSVFGTSETQQPATVRVGASYVAEHRFTVSGDVSLRLPVSYQLIKSAGLTDELRGRIPFNPNVRREPVVNFNIGTEVLIIREVSVAAGLFSDFSSAPPISRAPQTDGQPQVDIRGLTLTLGYFGKHSLSRVGILYSWGEGTDVIPTSDVGRLLRHEQTFQRVDYFQSFFYVFVSSTFRY